MAGWPRLTEIHLRLRDHLSLTKSVSRVTYTLNILKGVQSLAAPLYILTVPPLHLNVHNINHLPKMTSFFSQAKWLVYPTMIISLLWLLPHHLVIFQSSEFSSSWNTFFFFEWVRIGYRRVSGIAEQEWNGKRSRREWSCRRKEEDWILIGVSWDSRKRLWVSQRRVWDV